ncbi:hypothetical protein VPHK406_0024 [Vibrio phage K406]
MAFTQGDLTKLASKVLAAGVVSSENAKQWYEASLANNTIVDSGSVWSDMSSLKLLYANNVREACQRAFDNPEVLEVHGYNADGTFNDATAVRMTPVIGTNGHDWLITDTYNDPSSVIRNVISPTQVPRPNGLPSAAYSCRLFRGLPSLGDEIITTAGFDGAEVGWFFSAANSLALFADDTKPLPTEEIYAVFFQYVGGTGGSAVSGNNIVLEDPDGTWRISAADGVHLHFERYDEVSDGVFEWKTWFKVGGSASSDGIILTKPYAINADLNPESLDDMGDPILRSVFRVSGSEEDFIYGNSQQATTFETKRGTELTRNDAVRVEQEFENRPLADEMITLDTTDTPTPDSVTEISWISNIDYDKQTDYIRFNELAFEVLNIEEGDTECPVRISVETVDGGLIQENVTVAGLNAGINGGFNLKEGYHFYPINPKYTDRKDAQTITRLQVAKGHRLTLSGGIYNAIVTAQDGTTTQIQQLVPRQMARVEYLNKVALLDESNMRDLIHKNTGVVVDNGIHLYNEEFSNELFPLVAGADHTNAYNPVLGNYEDQTFIASGDGGVKVLFEDSSTRTQFWTEGDKQRQAANATPQFWQEVTELTLDISGIFTSELTELGWEVVNVENFLPLIRYEGDDTTGYRVEVNSTIVDYQFQQSQDRFEFLDGVIKDGFGINPTIDLAEPDYVKLRLPRSKYTVNLETPRTVTYQFMEPVKVYGYYKDPTDPLDQTTGTFVPSVKADVLRVFEEAIVSGEDLEDKVSGILGEKEWSEATLKNLPTLHVLPSLEWLTDEEGEVLLWSDVESLFFPTDEHQWLFGTGQEAYFELEDTQGTWSDGNSVFTFKPVVVHVPTDDVQGFEASFGWSDTFNNNGALTYGKFTMYINSHGRGFDSKVEMNIPRNASVNWRFRRRRSGEYSMIATPMNDNLASTGLGKGTTLTEIPVDSNPPISS